MSLSNIVFYLLLLRNQLKIYHWQTNIYARHKASDKFVEGLDDLTDKYVEAHQGIHGIVKLDTKFDCVKFQNITDENITSFVKALRMLIKEETSKLEDSELLNIRDEILDLIDKTLYLFHLR